MSEAGRHEGPGGMDAIDDEPVIDSDAPGGMNGIPDPDPDRDDARASDKDG